jgi:hypothetical protein
MSIGPDARATDMEIFDSTSTVLMSVRHSPDTRIADMEIGCWRLAVRTFIPHGPDAQSLIWKLLVADVRPSGQLCHPVRTRLLNRKDFSRKLLKNPVLLLSVQTAQVHRPDGVRTYYCSHPFCTSSYKQRLLGIENCKNLVLNSTSVQRSNFERLLSWLIFSEAIASVMLLRYIWSLS